MRRLLRAIQSQIRYQIILPYLALTLLVMMVGTAISIALVSASWEERLTNQLAQVARNTSEALVQRERDHLVFLLQVASAAQNPNTNAPSIADALTSNDPQLVERTITPFYQFGVQNANLDFDRLIAFNKQGKALLDWLRTSDDKNQPPVHLEGTDLSNVPTIQNIINGTVVNGDDKFVNLILFNPDPQAYFYTVVPVKQNTEVIGGVLIAIKLDRMLTSIEHSSQAAITTFYDFNGQAIGSSVLRRDSELQDFKMPEPVIRQLRNGQANSVFTVDIRKIPYELAYSPLVFAGHQVGYFSVGLSRDFQVQSVSISRNAIIAITITLTIGATLLGYWIAKHITVPLASLVETAEAVTAGDLERQTIVQSKDELGRLARAFNQMTEHLLRLYRTSRELNTVIEVDAVLDVTAQTLQTFAPGTEVMALLDNHGVWYYRLRSHAPPAVQALQHLRVAPGDPLLQQMAQGEMPRLLSSLDDPRLEGLGLTNITGFRSVLLTPLVLQNTLAGVLIFASPRLHVFSEAFEPTVLAIANMAASTLCNAVLFDRVHEEAGERQAILQSIADGVIMCDSQHNIIMVNDTAETMLGWHDWHIVRRNFADVPLERIQGPALFGTTQTELEHYRLNGKVVGLSRAPVVAEHGRVLGEVFVLHDLSAEAAIDQAKTDFIATISHELRTPLTPICGNTELLLRGTFGELNNDQREMLENVRVRADQLKDLVNNIVLVASIQADTLQTEIEPQEVWVAIEQAVSPLRRSFNRKGLALRIEIPPDIPLIMADREHLRLILTQLLDNAWRYTQQGEVIIGATRHGTHVQIDITDTGRGIPADEFNRLFTKFHRVEGNNSAERGSGLGLAITQQLVERQGGQVWVQSEVGRGSTFSLSFPIADGQDDAVAEQENADTAA